MLITFHSSTHRPVSEITQTESNYDDDVVSRLVLFSIVPVLSADSLRQQWLNYIFQQHPAVIICLETLFLSLLFFVRRVEICNPTWHDNYA
jgi:hypothetical protein